MKLKTLNDIRSIWKCSCGEIHAHADLEELKAEAIRWVKKEGMIITADEWCDFFNITEEDLK